MSVPLNGPRSVYSRRSSGWLVFVLALLCFAPLSGWAKRPPVSVLFATGTTSLGTTQSIQQTLGTRGTHIQVRTPIDAFRVPYHQLPPTPAVPIDSSQTRTFFASDLAIGSAGAMRPGPGVTVFQVHLRAPRDNLLSPPAQIVPDARTGIQPFLIPPITDAFVGGGFVVINFLVSTPQGPAQMNQLGTFLWPSGGGPPLVNLNPPLPGFITTLVGGLGIENETETLTDLIEPLLGSWEVVRSGFEGPARILLEAKLLVIQGLTAEPQPGGRLKISAGAAILPSGTLGRALQWDVLVVDRTSRTALAAFTGQEATFTATWDGVARVVPGVDPQLTALIPIGSAVSGIEPLVRFGGPLPTAVEPQVVAVLRDPGPGTPPAPTDNQAIALAIAQPPVLEIRDQSETRAHPEGRLLATTDPMTAEKDENGVSLTLTRLANEVFLRDPTEGQKTRITIIARNIATSSNTITADLATAKSRARRRVTLDRDPGSTTFRSKSPLLLDADLLKRAPQGAATTFSSFDVTLPQDSDSFVVNMLTAETFPRPREQMGQTRSISRFPAGKPEFDVLLSTSSAFKAAGFETLTVSLTATPSVAVTLHVKNQADVFYYSGHGLFVSNTLFTRVTTETGPGRSITPCPPSFRCLADNREVIPIVPADWNDNLTMAIFAGCSILNINDYKGRFGGARESTFPFGPGVTWDAVAGNPRRQVILLGYNAEAPSEAQSQFGFQADTIIISSYFRELRSPTRPFPAGHNPKVIAWLRANVIDTRVIATPFGAFRKRVIDNASAIDRTGYYFIGLKDRKPNEPESLNEQPQFQIKFVPRDKWGERKPKFEVVEDIDP